MCKYVSVFPFAPSFDNTKGFGPEDVGEYKSIFSDIDLCSISGFVLSDEYLLLKCKFSVGLDDLWQKRSWGKGGGGGGGPSNALIQGGGVYRGIIF